MANGDSVTLYSPSGKTLQVAPALVDKAVAKGWSKTPAQPKAAPATAPKTTAPATEPKAFKPGSYSYEIPAGVGRALKGMATYFPQAAKSRGATPTFGEIVSGKPATGGDESQFGAVGNILMHSMEDIVVGLQHGKEARDKAAREGEGLAGQVLATLEKYPIISGAIQKAEEAGPGYFKLAPQTMGAMSELLTLKYAPKAIDKATGFLKPEALRDRAAEINTEVTKSAKITAADPKGTAAGLRVALEKIHGDFPALERDIEVSRKAKEVLVEESLRKHDAAKTTVDMSKQVTGIISEIKQVMAQRGTLSNATIKALDNFQKDLSNKIDPTTKAVVARDWSKMTPREFVNLTRHDGLLASAAKYYKEGSAPRTAVENTARRIQEAGNRELGQVDPELVSNRTAESELIRARDGVRDARTKALNGTSTNLKGVFRSGTGAVALYIGLKAAGVPYAEAYAIPLLLYSVAGRPGPATARAAMYARAAEWIDALVNGKAKPGVWYNRGYQAGRMMGGRGSAQPPTMPPQGPPTPPTAPSGPQGPSAAPSATSAQSAPVSATAATVTAAPKALPAPTATAAKGEAAAAPGVVTHATPKPAEAPKAASVKAAEPPKSAPTPKAEPTVTKVPEGVSGLSPKAQKLFTEIDELLSKKPKTGAEKEFQTRRAKEIQLELKEAKLTPEETKQLQGAFKLSPERRTQVREAQRRFREKAAAEAPTSQGAVAAAGAPEAGVEAGSGAVRQAVGSEPTGEHVVIRIDSAYKAIMAEYPEAAGMVAELKKQAKAAKVNGTHIEATAAEDALDVLRSAGKE